MKILKIILILIAFLTLLTGMTLPAQALSANDVSNFSAEALRFIMGIALAVSTLFLVKAGYTYITSSGHPEALDSAKRTIRNTLLGLAVVLAATVLASLLSGAYHPNVTPIGSQSIPLADIKPATDQGGLTQVLIDAISGFLKNITVSTIKPLVDSVVSFLTSTPLMSTNPTIFNFWLVILGITDSLFVVFIALLGLHLMSSEVFGFDEIPLQMMLPRIGLAFLGANISIFLIDWVIMAANALNGQVIALTGGLAKAWLFNAFDPTALISSAAIPLVSLIFLGVFEVLTVFLILFYISRIIIVSLGAVLSPLIFLLWLLPKTAPLAEILTKGYFVAIFSVFIQVVTIQLASAVLSAPGISSPNSLISILVAIGILLTLLRTPPLLLELTIHSSQNMTYKKLGGQVINTLSRINTKRVGA